MKGDRISLHELSELDLSEVEHQKGKWPPTYSEAEAEAFRQGLEYALRAATIEDGDVQSADYWRASVRFGELRLAVPQEGAFLYRELRSHLAEHLQSPGVDEAMRHVDGWCLLGRECVLVRRGQAIRSFGEENDDAADVGRRGFWNFDSDESALVASELLGRLMTGAGKPHDIQQITA